MFWTAIDMCHSSVTVHFVFTTKLDDRKPDIGPNSMVPDTLERREQRLSSRTGEAMTHCSRTLAIYQGHTLFYHSNVHTATSILHIPTLN